MKNEDYLLWKRLKEGDPEALEEIYSLYAEDMIDYGIKMTCNVQITQDAVHDVFMELITHRKNISQISDIRPYLLKALRNNLLRKINREIKTSEDIENKDVFLLTDSVDTDGLDDEQKRIINRISKLSRLEREIICLRFFEELTNKQISRVLNLKDQTIKNVVSTALKKLRKHITDITE